MPLRAILNGKYVFSYEYNEDSWNDLKASYKQHTLQMPCCNSHAIPKVSKLNNYFFAHSRKGECLTAPESAEHIFLKTLIARKAISLGWNVVTEQPGETPEGEQWIADVFCTKGKTRVVFEVQWSPQTDDEFRRRQEKYIASGIRSAWLYRLRGNRDYFQTEIPYEHRIPVFGMRYRDNNKELYVPQFDVSVENFVSGMLQGKLKWFPSTGEKLSAKLIPILESCWRCKRTTKVIVGVSFHNVAGKKISSVCFTDDGTPELIMKHINNKMLASHGVGAIKSRYSKTVEKSYLSNGCCHCDAIQGDFFISMAFAEGHYDFLEPIFEFIVNNGEEGAPHIKGNWYFEEKQSKYSF